MNDKDLGHNTGFWQRQFGPDFTRCQVVFDALAGIAGPLACLVFDPFVFSGRSALFGSPLAHYRVFAHLEIALGTIMLASWLVFGARTVAGSPFFAGIFLFGALFASGIGVILLPYTLLGLPLGVGFLGLIPFVAAFVYLRNGLRALHRIKQLPTAANPLRLVGLVSLSLAVAIALPTIAQWQTSRIVSESVQAILLGDAHEVELGVQNLKGAFWCGESCYTEILAAYQQERGTERGNILAAAYKEVTGKEIELALWQMQD